MEGHSWKGENEGDSGNG